MRIKYITSILSVAVLVLAVLPSGGTIPAISTTARSGSVVQPASLNAVGEGWANASDLVGQPRLANGLTGANGA
jgi:hypothetical protein